MQAKISERFIKNGFLIKKNMPGLIIIEYEGKEYNVFIIDRRLEIAYDLFIYLVDDINPQVDFICDLIHLKFLEDSLDDLIRCNEFYNAYLLCLEACPVFYSGSRIEDLFARYDFLNDFFEYCVLCEIQCFFIREYLRLRDLLIKVDSNFASHVFTSFKNFLINEITNLCTKYIGAFPPKIRLKIASNYNNFILRHK